MQKKTLYSTLALIAAGAMGLSVATAGLAYQGDPAQHGPNYTPERHVAMEEAFNSNDFQAWKELRQGRGRISEIINENNFAKFAQAHKLAEAGKKDEAQAIRQELGIGNGHGQFSQNQGQGTGYGRHRNFNQQ